MEMTLNGHEVPPNLPSLFWTFRPPETYDLPLGKKEGFLEEVTKSFERYVQLNKDAIVTNLLSRILLVDDAYLVSDMLYWFIPLTRDELKADYLSEFSISTKIEDDYGISMNTYYTRLRGETREEEKNLPPKYWGGKIRTVAFEPQAEIKNMRCGKIIKVFIQRYIPALASQEAITSSSPSNIEIKEK
jgi:hypothetical protein